LLNLKFNYPQLIHVTPGRPFKLVDYLTIRLANYQTIKLIINERQPDSLVPIAFFYAINRENVGFRRIPLIIRGKVEVEWLNARPSSQRRWENAST
jgi:hypothetical protein